MQVTKVDAGDVGLYEVVKRQRSLNRRTMQQTKRANEIGGQKLAEARARERIHTMVKHVH